jgi:hypothetical protein
MISCEKKYHREENTIVTEEPDKDRTLINPKGENVKERFDLPEGFERFNPAENSFEEYLQSFPLLPDTAQVTYYNGKKKKKKVYLAVLDIDIGAKDLQQCADAIMRLRGEYLFKQKRYSDICFSFTNGFKAEYVKWAEGYRIQVHGNKTQWIKTQLVDYSYQNFKNYIFYVYIYAGTLSLAKELNSKNYKNLSIGDVFIQEGSPGHAMLVMDAAIHTKTQKKIYLLAQSYMPAQSIHIVKNPNNPDISPWYELNENDLKIRTPEWTFKTTDLKDF